MTTKDEIWRFKDSLNHGLSETWPKEFFRGNFPGEKKRRVTKIRHSFFPKSIATF